MLPGSFARIILSSSGLAAAAAEAAAPALALLLSRSFSIGGEQLVWNPLATVARFDYRSFSSAWQKPAKQKGAQPQRAAHRQQQKPPQKHSKRHAQAETLLGGENNTIDDAWASTVAPTALRLSRGSSHRQQQQQQQHTSVIAAADSKARRPLFARVTDAGSATDSSEWIELPRALGFTASAGSGQLATPLKVDDGQLMALIHKASSIQDMEQILLQHHSQFRYYHVAAAVAKVPALQPDSALNTRRRMNRLTTLLASGLLAVSHQFDPHQTLACSKALTSPACLNPFQSAPLNRLMSVLVAEQGAGLRKLHSYELADAAAAAATVQQILQQQQQQQQHDQVINGPQDTASQATGVAGLLEAREAAAGTVVPAAAANSSGALALQSPLQQLWALLESVSQPQLDSFSAASLSLLAYSYARAGKASRELMLHIGNAALAKHLKFDSPHVIVQLLQALALTSSSNQQQLLGVLAAATAQHKAQFGPRHLADAAAAFAQLGFYSEEACLAICKVASRSLKHWPASDVATLMSALARLRFRDEVLLKAVVKHLPGKVAAGQLSGVQLADVLAAVVQLSYSAPDLEKLLATCFSQLSHMSAELSPAAAIKLLWVSAVLGEGNTALQQLLLRKLSDVRPKQLNHQLLRMLYQAHRLLTHDWLSGRTEQQQQQQGAQGSTLTDDADAISEDESYYITNEGSGFAAHPKTPFVVVFGDDSSSSGGESGERGAAEASGHHHHQQQEERTMVLEGGFTLHDISTRESSIMSGIWPQRLLTAARSAAAVHASTSAGRSQQQQQHVQDLFEGLGYEAPVKGLRLDGGALQPDLALTAADRNKHKQQSGDEVGSAAADLKVAIMCDHAGRYSRNVPYQLMGYETVSGWLLEQCGWKVVRLAPHEWRLLLDDRGVDEGTALAFLYNSLASQGVSL